MMPREDVNPASLSPPAGFSYVSVARGSKLVCIAGMVALDREGEIVGGNDLAKQTTAAMRNIETAIGEIGIGWNDIVRRTIYTLHPTEWEVIAAAIDDVTGGAPHPAQTVIGVSGLAMDGLLLEIECTALVD
jgi:enamine deaminase RidA (YjgF/YER057c/UK114 family)